FPRLRGAHGDWPGEAWPEDLMISADGPWTRGWAVKDKEGNWVHCGVLCDSRAPAYARERISEELATHPYRCRFIDTTTASPWRECYHPAHPMTRTESRIWKMALLRLVGEEFGVVTGSETGHDAAVPCVDYFEGMLSLGPYRVPDAGRNMQRLWHEVPERVARFQVGHYYRLPLWELVYHDCVVAQWYWGDYNNKLPAVWKQRDLLNALYGTPPMFMFDRALWEGQRDRFVASYQESAPVVRACGYSEMLQHRWLTEDHAVQQSRFEGGLSVTVNFGDVPFRMADGHVVAPLSKRVQGLP
ncbi:MAG: glycoside hydrolase, partial [Planctomycetota bacterium]